MSALIRSAALLAAYAAIFFCSRTSMALDGSNVLVLYNASSSDGLDIAQYYAQVHPGVQLLGLENLPAGDQISAATYLNSIRPQVLPALTPSTQIIVTTKGLPLRIDAGTKPAGNQSNNWKRYSSLESELARVDSISTVEQMGDQFWVSAEGTLAAANPYYSISQPFDHATYATRLTSRLDGFTVSDVTGSIDRAQRAVVSGSASQFRFVLDDDPSKNYDRMPQLAGDVLGPRDMGYSYDNTSEFVGTSDGLVLGYVSHGVHQASTPPGYIPNGLSFATADGAVFHSWESFNAYSFTQGGNRSGQGLVGEWLARGGTAAVGHVEEPWASVFNVANEDQMFRMLLDGHTWAESAWSATRQVSFVNTVIGDPLMTWRLLGDMDGNHVLDNHDIQAFELALTDRTAFLAQFPSLTDYRVRGDVNLDGVFDNYDIGAFEWLLTQGHDDSASAAPVPEPSSCFLLALAIVLLAPSILRRLSRSTCGPGLTLRFAV